MSINKNRKHNTKHDINEIPDGVTKNLETKMPAGESVSQVIHLYLNRKGSNCSTPISATVRSEYDYPSINFVRTPKSELSTLLARRNEAKGISLSTQMSLEEAARLQIRLHYNPVMDEWVR